MNYAKHGELLPYIVKVGSFDEECTRFYTAEILLAIEHLHRLNIIHRYVMLSKLNYAYFFNIVFVLNIKINGTCLLCHWPLSVTNP